MSLSFNEKVYTRPYVKKLFPACLNADTKSFEYGACDKIIITRQSTMQIFREWNSISFFC
jgi:hypothetical protein